MTTDQHDFVFSRDFVDGRRICGQCRLNFDQGNHNLIEVLKPYTRYVCPESSGGMLGHSGIWTGAYQPEGRRRSDNKCACGATLVEEDTEQWRLSWEKVSPFTGEWRPVTNVQSKHAALSQQAGLLDLIDQGEPIRNVVLEQVAS